MEVFTVSGGPQHVIIAAATFRISFQSNEILGPTNGRVNISVVSEFLSVKWNLNVSCHINENYMV
jgi:hypothetical protein